MMDFVGPEENGSGGSSDEHNREDPLYRGRGQKLYHRHSANIIQHLEAFFKENQHPNESQRQQLSRDLGLEPRQIKFWFQNKRTQTKANNERLSNTALRIENEHLHYENIAMNEAMKNLMCNKCEGLGPGGIKEAGQDLQKLKIENEFLKGEYERVQRMIVNTQGRIGGLSYRNLSLDIPNSTVANFGGGIIGGGNPSNKNTLFGIDLPNITGLGRQQVGQLNHFPNIQDMEQSVFVTNAIKAMDELVELVSIDDPLWIKSPIDGSSMIHSEIYKKLYPKIMYIYSPGTWIESSKESGILLTSTSHLLNVFHDPVMFMEFFPTIVTKTKKIETLDTLGQEGSLYLMHQKLHVLSPLVAPREFIFFRYIRQMNSTTWIITQFSYDFFKEVDTSTSHAWLLPSGCMIEDLSNGTTRVTWVEHVHVDDKSHQLYKDTICDSQAYGAKRWIVSLERTCERYAFLAGLKPTPSEPQRVINTTQSRAAMGKISDRMVKKFHQMLSMQEKYFDSPQLPKLPNHDFKVLLRRYDNHSSTAGANGMVVCVIASLRIPTYYENLFNFLKDDQTRAHWDVLSNGNPVEEIAHISTGSHPGNAIFLKQPGSSTKENSNMLILQENNIDRLGASLIYSPLKFPTVMSIMCGVDNPELPTLPSGFVIANESYRRVDGGGISHGGASTSCSSSRPGGGMSSLLTVVLQIPTFDIVEESNMVDSIASIYELMNSTIEKIKIAVATDVE
ncbi:OLC1v1031070C1 [Oldenlandia corymbosa var. corymbosa]|uniref:OLC1v1031070C1 n=1 Tax=Oldenlandia corymbosa var. corymbosa TaxID=529605 RepID=A0AAV1CHN0_OLDCO|nr:OLC1v1031070C1 [Oldenlandia corymbosa var. corymbosa]